MQVLHFQDLLGSLWAGPDPLMSNEAPHETPPGGPCLAGPEDVSDIGGGGSSGASQASSQCFPFSGGSLVSESQSALSSCCPRAPALGMQTCFLTDNRMEPVFAFFVFF